MTIFRSLVFTAIFVLIGCSSGGSTDSSAQVPTGPLTTDPIVSIENHAFMLREIVKIANDEILDSASAEIDPVFTLVEDLIDRAISSGSANAEGLTFLSRDFADETGARANYTFSCDSGGTLVAFAYALSDLTDDSMVEQLSTEGACSIGDAAYEGTAFKQLRFHRAPNVLNFDNLSVSKANGDSLELHGEYYDSSPENRGAVVTGWTLASLTKIENGEEIAVNGYSSNRTSNVPSVIPGSQPGNAVAEVAFTVTAPWSSGEPLNVVVNLTYEAEGELVANEDGSYPAQWQHGILRVTAADGSGLALSPDTGNDATFSVLIDGMSTDPITYFWADGYQIVCAEGFDCR